MIIFNSNGDFHGSFSSLPNEDYLDETEWTIAEFVEGESFDPRYNYTSVDNIAVKGDLIDVDLEEEARMEAEWQTIKYQQDREYPPIGDQLDALFHAGAFPDDMAAQIQAVKDKYPKPE
jgi:hypothetical protein